MQTRVSFPCTRPVQNGKLIVTKVITSGGSKYFGASMQINEFAELRRLGGRDRISRFRELVDAGRFPGLGPAQRAAGEVDRLMDEYEAAHPELAVATDRESQFFGPRNVGGGKLDKFTKFVLVPAVRDAASETQRRGAAAQLIDLIVARKINSRRDFKQFKADFLQKARELFGRNNLPELADFGRLITDRLRRYAPGAELTIDFEDIVPPEVQIPGAVISVSEDNLKVPIRYTGHGLQRALILALLEQLAQTVAPPEEIEGDEAAAEAAGGPAEREAKREIPSRPPDLILAIEEPELYLHPNRSRYLSSILRILSTPPADVGAARIQVKYVTHSPYFVDMDRFDEVRIARKERVQDSPGTTRFYGYTREAASKRLAEITGKPAEHFTARSFMTRSGHILNSLVNEGLFADAVVVVEGASDVAALWAAQKVLTKRWDELGIVIVSAEGKNNIDRIVVSFSGFGISTYFLFDGDANKKNKGKGDADCNRALLKLADVTVEDYPVTVAHDRCAVFNDKLETELELALGEKRFQELRQECAAACEFDRPADSLKNPEVMALFIKSAYESGHKIQVLENIIERVSP
jgi:hypothetical protein